jgi:hypothetical protein
MRSMRVRSFTSATLTPSPPSAAILPDVLARSSEGKSKYAAPAHEWMGMWFSAVLLRGLTISSVALPADVDPETCLSNRRSHRYMYEHIDRPSIQLFWAENGFDQ